MNIEATAANVGPAQIRATCTDSKPNHGPTPLLLSWTHTMAKVYALAWLVSRAGRQHVVIDWYLAPETTTPPRHTGGKARSAKRARRHSQPSARHDPSLGQARRQQAEPESRPFAQQAQSRDCIDELGASLENLALQ